MVGRGGGEDDAAAPSANPRDADSRASGTAPKASAGPMPGARDAAASPTATSSVGHST